MYFAGNGPIENLVCVLYPDGAGQIQESGRDQGHSTGHCARGHVLLNGVEPGLLSLRLR